jgi:predicted nucleic acid-binding protein
MGGRFKQNENSIMKYLLFDSSIWVDKLNGIQSAKIALLADYLKNPDFLFITPTIIQEISQGIRFDEQYLKVKKHLQNLQCLQLDAKEAAFGAAELYRNLRKKGVTIRKPNDCLIAFYAIYFEMELVHNDSDFDLMIDHIPLKIYQA